MLRSTGFFRGIDCPFNADSANNNSNGKSGGERCDRPYCHFRHCKPRRASYNPNHRESKDFTVKQKEQGYDPYNPEVVRPSKENGDPEKPLGPLDPGFLELELVNKAIEAVKSEVEREQKRLSRIGDQEYDPTAGVKGHKAASKEPFGSLEYDPGSYQIASTGDYNPTPRSIKYTLDSDSKSQGNSMEYIPTVVPKKAIKKPAPPPAAHHKYTLDNSKPSTDLEYDPLSNYSARPLSKKGAKDQKIGKRHHETGTPEEGYIPTFKKPRQQVDSQKYSAALSFSESDDENGTEYRPSPISRLRRSSVPDDVGKCWPGIKWSGGDRKEVASAQYDSEDTEGPDQGGLEDRGVEKKLSCEVPEKKSIKTDRARNGEKPSKKTDLKDKIERKAEQAKIPNKEACKKGRHEGKKLEERDKAQEKIKERSLKEFKKSEGGSGKVGKHKAEGKKMDKGAGDIHAKKGNRTGKALERGDKNRKDSRDFSKHKELNNGKLQRSSSSSSSGGVKDKKTGSKDHVKKSRSLEEKAPHVAKVKKRTLSHADLFGDESAEEDQDEEEEGDSSSSSSSCRRPCQHVKEVTKSSSKRKASEFSSSSSENEEPENEADYSGLQLDLDYDSDPMEECLRIFNESKDVKTEDKGRQTKQAPKEPVEDTSTDSTLTTLFPGQKKRVSHFVTKGDTEVAPKSVIRPYRRPTAQEICYKRMQIAQQQAVQLAAAVKTAAAMPAYPGEKKRVAHRPGPSAPAARTGPVEGKKAGSSVASPSRSGSSSLSVKAHTSAAMPSKTSNTTVHRRVAHTPTLKSSSLKRPVIPTEFGAKVPTNVRQRYLNIFIDECLKFCASEEEAFEKALEEEKVVYNRSSSRNIYLNVAVNVLKKLRSQSNSPVSPANKSPRVGSNKKTLSHEEMLGGKMAAKTSFTIKRSGRPQEEELTGLTLYRKMTEYLMTEEQLQEHGYPRPNPDKPSRALLYNTTEKKTTDPFTKVCCRCGAEYMITPTGNCVRREECNHHWGRLRRHRAPGGWEMQYSCCSGAVGSPGCQVCKQHVQDGRKENLDGFMTTFSKSTPADGNPGVYALDCEMCYTKQGLELTRVTVINSDLRVIYDTFVKPDSKVVDYNTRFSGVTEEDLQNTTITIRDVQAVLLSMFSAESILIGHSLESDLLALKLIHSTVVDTAIVFPHRLGLPYKRALRTLMADYLKRIIQDNVEGHDSSEDACACMELMIWKIKEDAKVKR
ncbi:RNA exonuclease 1 homolog [Amia ocellicauda]|uniref:RNA exonuclease 1 homolog n=1 Tax=Amia ocellicauda TaxID=2972642 RepID=UPI003464DFE4